MFCQTCQISLDGHLFHNVEVQELILGLEVLASNSLPLLALLALSSKILLWESFSTVCLFVRAV